MGPAPIAPMSIPCTLDRPDVLFEPAHERQIVGETPWQGHARMDVDVGESRQGQVPRRLPIRYAEQAGRAWAWGRIVPVRQISMTTV